MGARRVSDERHEDEAWFQTVRMILMRHWDPLAVNDRPLAFDEYDAYATRVVAMLREDEPELRRIEAFLREVERDWLDLPDADPALRRDTLARLGALRRGPRPVRPEPERA